jgi:acyl dehydratase
LPTASRLSAALTPQRTTGIVAVAVAVHNQNGELVLTGEQKYLLKKRRT